METKSLKLHLTAASTDYIDFETIQKMLGLTDITLFLSYLKEVFKDLADRTESNKKKGISKVTFYEYMKLPIFICEKLFMALDKDNDSLWSVKEFIEGLQTLYMGEYEETVDFIFNMLDFDKDGVITKEDVKILLSFLPLKTDNSKIEYKFQMESWSEIDEILSHTFSKNTLDAKEFKQVLEEKKSDVYWQILCFLYQKKPFKTQNIKTWKASKKQLILNTPKVKVSTPNIGGDYQPSPSKKWLTPSRKTTLSPAEAFIKAAQLQENILGPRTKQSFIDENTPQMSGMKGMIRMNNEKIPQKQMDDDEANGIKTPNVAKVIKNSKDVYSSPTVFLKRKGGKQIPPQIDLASNLIKMEKLDFNIESDSSDEEEDKKKKSKKEKEKEKSEITYENWIYKISESNKLIKYYLVTIGKDIYYYKSDKKEEWLGMHNLSGCYIRANGDKIICGNKYYCFQIIFPSKKRNYYTDTKSIAQNFVTHLKHDIGYLNFFDFYEMLDDIGEGKFGLVKLGVHKSTQQRVAIKIIKKEAMTNSDIELVKSEIDIMKLCHHPNIVRLLDHFENAEYIFIVMELISGGSLEHYFMKNNFNFTEEKASEILYQISLGIKYLHQYGVLHRDLKPENIMMTECNDQGTVKIMDFGLSKIIGPKEKVVDGFGTLSFVAPEVLVRTPYNKQIDIWSIGVILYYMLTGKLPFDDSSDNEEVIAKMIVFNEVKFPEDQWAKRSKSVINLIKQLLTKDPEKRITVDKLLANEWFDGYKKKFK